VLGLINDVQNQRPQIMKGEAFIQYCGSGEAALLLRCAMEACFAAAVGAGCKIDKYARWVDGLVKVQNDLLTMDFTNKEAAGAIDFTARCFILQPENWSLFGSMCWPEFQTTATTIENRLVRNENRARRTDNAVHLEWAWLIERNPVSDDAPGEINSEARNADEGLSLAAGAIHDVQRYAIAALDEIEGDASKGNEGRASKFAEREETRDSCRRYCHPREARVSRRRRRSRPE
jgi:hypothetical protein